MLTRRGRRRQRAAGPRRRRTAGQGQWGSVGHTRGTGHGAGESSTALDQGFFLRTRYSTTLVTADDRPPLVGHLHTGLKPPPPRPTKEKKLSDEFRLENVIAARS